MKGNALLRTAPATHRTKGNSLLPGAVAKVTITGSHARAPKQEKELAKRLGGRTTAASGAKDEKGDVRVRGVARVECKTTKNKSFSVTLDMFRKIEDAALSAAEVPVLMVEFNDGNGRKLGELAVIPAYYLEDFVETKR